MRISQQRRTLQHPCYKTGILQTVSPLGRFYEDGGFKYILQIHECPKTNRSKIKVKKWIDTPDLKNYEKFVNDWHYFLLDVQEVLYNAEDADLIKESEPLCGKQVLPEAL